MDDDIRDSTRYLDNVNESQMRPVTFFSSISAQNIDLHEI